MVKKRIPKRRKREEEDQDQTPAIVEIHGPELGKIITLEQESIIIGSGKLARILVEDDTVSLAHAELKITDEKNVIIRDLKSSNGTFVNFVPIENVQLKNGDDIQIGPTVFRFFSENVQDACKEELQHLATYDGLTGLYNRKAFKEHMELEITRCKHYGRDLSVFIYGLDNISDHERVLGDVAVDNILVHVTRVVASHLGKSEYHARYGNDEFAILLPEVNQAEALQKAEIIRKSVQNSRFTWAQEPLKVTISIGVATFEKNMEDAQDFMDEIDKNLYQSTKAGRNRVIGLEGGVTRCS